MKKYLFLALGVAALTSCSSDEVTELNQGNEIKFSVVADNDSRAATVYCNNNLMDEFYVYANDGTNAFINADWIKSTDGVNWNNTTATKRYWPETDALNFYAIYGAFADTKVDNKAIPSINDFAPSTTVAEQVDVLYAYTPGQTQQNSGGTVALNFRHALSQIEFQAKNTNQHIDVQIEQVVVGNVLSSGDFTMPTGTTNENKYGEHNGGSDATVIANQGTWALNAAKACYTVATSDANAFVALNDITNLTCAIDEDPLNKDATDKNWKKTMLLLPQTADENAPNYNGGKWNATSVVTPENVVGTTAGTYLGVKCKIYNVTKVDTDADGDLDVVRTPIYGKDGYKWALVPVDLTWEQGKKYVYTFVFSTGNGGFTPEGDEVLNDIALTVTVDDFILGEGSPFDTPMKTE